MPDAPERFVYPRTVEEAVEALESGEADVVLTKEYGLDLGRRLLALERSINHEA